MRVALSCERPATDGCRPTACGRCVGFLATSRHLAARGTRGRAKCLPAMPDTQKNRPGKRSSLTGSTRGVVEIRTSSGSERFNRAQEGGELVARGLLGRGARVLARVDVDEGV